MKRIVIVGAGYSGFYTAWGLEKRLRPDEASVTVVDFTPYMTYQPFWERKVRVSLGCLGALLLVHRLAGDAPAPAGHLTEDAERRQHA